MKKRKTPPSVFWMLSFVAILWNLLGMYFWLFQNFFMNDEVKLGLSPERLEMHNNAPSWGIFVFGIATICGVLGSLFLIMRLRTAKILFVISLIAVSIQMAYRIFVMHAYDIMGIRGLIVPAIIIGVSVFLYQYSINAEKKQWIT